MKQQKLLKQQLNLFGNSRGIAIQDMQTIVNHWQVQRQKGSRLWVPGENWAGVGGLSWTRGHWWGMRVWGSGTFLLGTRNYYCWVKKMVSWSLLRQTGRGLPFPMNCISCWCWSGKCNDWYEQCMGVLPSWLPDSSLNELPFIYFHLTNILYCNSFLRRGGKKLKCQGDI